MEELEKLPLGVPGCARCAALEKKYEEIAALLKKAMEEIASLKERVGQNSRNSSKPPSQDPPNAPARPHKEPTGRKPGGQPGHEGKNRGLLPPEQVDHFVEYVPSECEQCGAPLPSKAGPADPAPRRHQVAEAPERLCELWEHQAHGRTCKCGHVTWAEIPPEIRGSSFGPRLVGISAFFSGSCHLSKRQVEEVMEDVFRVPEGIGLGTVVNMEREVTAALEAPYQAAAEAVREAPAKNLDETGWKVHGLKSWLWLAATATICVFSIHASRGRKGLRALLQGVRKGIFTSDRWGVYRRRAVRFRQLCWAHLLRDFQKLIDRGGKSAEIGRKAKDIGGWVFTAWKDFKSGGIDRETLKQCLRPLRLELATLLTAGLEVADQKTVHFCENLLALEPAIWTFVRCEGVEPTNNHAERLLRKGVLWRKGSFGTWSDAGSRFAERILTVVQTRRLQKRPVLSFLVDAVRAHRAGQTAPSLVAV
jgi:transposase